MPTVLLLSAAGVKMNRTSTRPVPAGEGPVVRENRIQGSGVWDYPVAGIIPLAIFSGIIDKPDGRRLLRRSPGSHHHPPPGQGRGHMDDPLVGGAPEGQGRVPFFLDIGAVHDIIG